MNNNCKFYTYYSLEWHHDDCSTTSINLVSLVVHLLGFFLCLIPNAIDDVFSNDFLIL